MNICRKNDMNLTQQTFLRGSKEQVLSQAVQNKKIMHRTMGKFVLYEDPNAA